jgi:ABC-type branched-subunit amino acid transport system substrate-binding protein
VVALLIWAALAAQTAAPEPTEIRIGYLGPADDDSGTAASLAIDRANREGGYSGKRFRLVASVPNRTSRATSHFVRLTSGERVWAIISALTGDESVRTSQLASKTRIPVIDVAGTTDAAAGGRPLWTFSCLPSDEAVVEAVGRAVLADARGDFVVLFTSDHDSWALGARLLSWFSRAGTRPRLHAEVSASAPSLPSGTKAVLLIAPARETAAILRGLPANVRVFGGPGMARSAFIKAAGARANGVRVPLLARTTDAFPDYAAAQTYDAVTMLVTAIRKAGLDHARIRDALERLSPWQGVAGELDWDAGGRNRRRVRLGTIAGGRVE